jgi:translocation and assembly module TamA
MRFTLARICCLLAFFSCLAPVARAADPQPYKVDLASTGDGAMDATLRATSDLITLRSAAPVSPYGLIARARGDLDRLKTVLESYGYYQSKVTIQIDGLALNAPGLAERLTALPKKRDARVQLSFALGPLYHVRAITIDGELPPSAQGKLGLKTGAPAVAANVLEAGARLLSVLEEQGYAFAKVDPPVAFEDATLPLLDVTFHVQTGSRVTIGEIRFEGLKRVHEKLLRRRLLLHTGEQYSSSAVERARGDLLSLGIFSAISVQLGTEVDGTGGVPVTFKMRERARHGVGVSAAYSTDLGGSGGVTWSDRNVFGNAEQLTVAASIINAGGNATNGLGYDTSVKYTLPDFGHRDQSLQFAVGAVKQYLEAYDQTALTTGVTLNRKLNKFWTVSAGVTTAEEHIIQDQPYCNTAVSPPPTMPSCTLDGIGGVVAPNPVPHDYTLVALPLTVSFDSTDLKSPLDDPTHGMRDAVSVAPTRSLGQTSATFIISQLRVATYFDLDHLLPTDPGRSVLAARALAGLAQGAGELSLPPDQRFYGGGSSSIRGYPYQGVGPQFKYSNIPIGGTAITAGALEFRQRFGQNLGAAFFIDGGQVSNKLKLLPSTLYIGIGAGIRYYTPIGPIRVDVAVPTKHYNNNGSDQAFQVYIGLGQAF